MLTNLNIPALRPVLLTLESGAGQADLAWMLAILATWPRAQRRTLASLICARAHSRLDRAATSLDPDEHIPAGTRLEAAGIAHVPGTRGSRVTELPRPARYR